MRPGHAERIVVVGSHAPGLFMRVERIPVAGETVIGTDFEEAVDGGKGSNQAIALGRLGVEASFVGRLGDDRLGDEGARWMRDAGVDLTYLKRSQTRSTGVSFILLDAAGVPAIAVDMGANAELCPADIDAAEPAIEQSGVMLIQLEIPTETALYAAAVGRRHQLTVILNPAPASELDPSIVAARVDILTPNETEAVTLLGEPAPNMFGLASNLRRKYNVRAVVVTHGETGATTAEGDEVFHVPAPVVPVADTTGAGDAFNAGLAVGLSRGWNLRQAVEFGCLVAALSVTRPGTIPSYPTAEEVERFRAGIGM